MRRMLIGGLFVVCAGFGPASSCAKGCGACGRSGDDIARSSRVADDFARARPTVRTGPRGTVATYGSTHLDETVAALPEVEGSISSVARTPSRNGATLTIDDTSRSFAGDYGKTIDKASITRDQHERLVDAFEIAQKVVELATSGDDDAQREAAVRRLDAKLLTILDDQQRARFYAHLGSPEVIVHRLARERPVRRE